MKDFFTSLYPKALLLFTVFYISTILAHNPQDAHLQNIIDFGDVLVKSAPSTFASQNLTKAINTNNINTSTVVLDNAESKTAAFQKSFITFLKEIYNTPDYTTTLSRDCSHILEFLTLSNELNLNANTALVCIRLFHNKIKGCEFVDDLAVLKLLEAMPYHLERYFIDNNASSPSYDQSFMKHHLERMLMDKLTGHIETIKTHPEDFSTELAQEIVNYYQQVAVTVQKQQSAQDSIQRFRALIIRFLETTIGKIMWSLHEPEVLVESFMMVGEGLLSCAEVGIIDNMDDLDDLLWTLTYRLSYFLEIAGAMLPNAFYENLESALENKAIFFLEYKEQDYNITTKKEVLIRQLLLSKAKSFAYDARGIISLPMLQKGKSMDKDVKIGAVYEHYSKKLYKVLGIAHHSETKEKMVVYQGLYDCPEFGKNPIWVRPKSMFLEEVTINGVTTPRFKMKQTQLTP